MNTFLAGALLVLGAAAVSPSDFGDAVGNARHAMTLAEASGPSPGTHDTAVAEASGPSPGTRDTAVS